MSCGRFQTCAFCVGSVGGPGLLRRPAIVAAAPTAEQIKKLHAADAALTKAESLYKENKMREAAAAFTQAQDALAEVAAAPEMAQRIQPFKKRLINLHDMMELDGAKVPAIAAALASAASAATLDEAGHHEAASPRSREDETDRRQDANHQAARPP